MASKNKKNFKYSLQREITSPRMLNGEDNSMKSKD